MHEQTTCVSHAAVRTVAALLSALSLAAVAIDARAQSAPEPGSLRERFPVSSIDSVERADTALAETAGAKSHIQFEYRSQARDCAKTFAVNACLDGARTLRRQRLADIEGVELEASRYKRRDKADRLESDRHEREADRAANAPTDSALRARNQKAFDERQAQATREAGERSRKETRTPAARSTPHPAIKVAPPADSTANAAMRAKNAAQHATKIREADAHLAEIDRRLVAKTAERKRHADEKAARDSKAATAQTSNGASRQ